MTQRGGGGYSTLWDGVLAALQRSPVTGTGGPPAEPFSETLQRVVSRHIAEEESSIERYRQLSEESNDPVVRMLIGELLGDEEQHHGMLRRMEAQLQAELGDPTEAPFTNVDAAAVELPEDQRRELVDTFNTLAKHEEEGAKHLHDRADDARKAGSDVLGLLLDTIAMDSRKHEHMLKFIAKRIADA